MVGGSEEREVGREARSRARVPGEMLGGCVVAVQADGGTASWLAVTVRAMWPKEG